MLTPFHFKIYKFTFSFQLFLIGIKSTIQWLTAALLDVYEFAHFKDEYILSLVTLALPLSQKLEYKMAAMKEGTWDPNCHRHYVLFQSK